MGENKSQDQEQSYEHTIKEVPIKYSVIHIPVVFHNLHEQFSQEIIIGRLLKPKFADVV